MSNGWQMADRPSAKEASCYSSRRPNGSLPCDRVLAPKARSTTDNGGCVGKTSSVKQCQKPTMKRKFTEYMPARTSPGQKRSALPSRDPGGSDKLPRGRPRGL